MNLSHLRPASDRNIGKENWARLAAFGPNKFPINLYFQASGGGESTPPNSLTNSCIRLTSSLFTG